ncbi:ABC transporter ATP-binding protein [Pelagibius sp. Alg239-R121]|uniref:ABC transporter ATP-binding protein n=1 Tax=Pelagibius sp. Alg239-R121 TaxID=2993448 RepID=UPI0024A6463C|nr:ATP-binding cassette domain-containing protein [Pelagibius sp. Alg239-R121]
MIRTVRMVNALLNYHERRRAVQVFALMLLMALVETLGVASIMPFVLVLASPGVIESNSYFSFVYNTLGFVSPDKFLILLGCATLSIFLFSMAVRAVTTYVLVRFTTMRLHTISCRLLSAYLRQPYSFFLGRNTADLGKSVLSEVNRVTSGILMPMLRLLSGAVVAIAILTLLLFLEPWLSLAVALVLGGAFTAVYMTSRQMLQKIGNDRVNANQLRFVLANEALSGIKELRLMGRVETYLQRFREPSERFARHQATSTLISDLPQFGIQALAFGGGLLTVIYLKATRGGLEEALPLISLYALAGYRLMPAFQLIFSNLTKIRFAMPALEVLYEDMNTKEAQITEIEEKAKTSIVRLNGAVNLQRVSFSYPNMDRPAVYELNLAIPRGTSVAFVGSTGAGKSTVVDLILGLLQPSQGRILIDGQLLQGSNLRGWQKNIGYVPQATYLADDTVAANIAFGVTCANVDDKAVERAAKAAQIHDFIVNDLPQGYDTVVGERGVRLSGGQRQRLAIARALYHDPEVVIFDEATSALDNVTEAIVMEAIDALRGMKTVIIIAHRFSTIRHCHRIYVMESGRLVADGAYGELVDSSAHFKKLVQSANA